MILVKYIQFVVPQQETTLKITSINDVRLIEPLEAKIQLDSSVQSIIALQETHMQVDEGYIKGDPTQVIFLKTPVLHCV